MYSRQLSGAVEIRFYLCSKYPVGYGRFNRPIGVTVHTVYWAQAWSYRIFLLSSGTLIVRARALCLRVTAYS